MKKQHRTSKNIPLEDWNTCIRVLQQLSRDPHLALDTFTLKGLVTKLYKQAQKREKQARQAALKVADQKKKAQTYIFQRNDFSTLHLPESIDSPSDFEKLARPIRCYICKEWYHDLHFFYHLLCPVCATFNLKKRTQKADLQGRVALITGGRIKIGFELGLKLLRDGATVILTTRFPNDANYRYAQVPDYRDWKNRLHIFGLDLRNLPQVEQFITKMYQQFPALDILINNAAQTVKRPLAYYAHLLEKEQQNHLLEAEKNSQTLAATNPFFPQGQLDKEGQQLDLRPKNSWIYKLEEVSLLEMLEVQLVNVTAPFLLNSGLKRLMRQSTFERKFIVNVSAMEGKFNRAYKSVFHPHTNMAKAALNMMTRTAAADFVQTNIFMTSVDTGWITDENPEPKKNQMRAGGFVAPLDVVDGAARIYDPIVQGLTKENTPLFGMFLKDYYPTSW